MPHYDIQIPSVDYSHVRFVISLPQNINNSHSSKLSVLQVIYVCVCGCVCMCGFVLAFVTIKITVSSNSMCYHLSVDFLNAKLVEAEQNGGYQEITGRRNGEMVLEYNLAASREIGPGDLMHSTVLTVNNTVL